jgi:2-polyprenyl-3-methyl-5-hydroxy-6-metoxy-1,4-benzoquinol methylase
VKLNGAYDSFTYNLPEHVDKFYGNTKQAQDYIKKNADHIKSLLRLFQKKNMNLDSKSVIDIGCGTGHCLQEIDVHYKEVALTGVEFSEQALKLASAVVPDARLIRLDIAQQALQEEFDAVLCQQVLEHIPDAETALKNLWLMTAPNGFLVITVPNGRLDSFAGHIHFWSKESFTIFLEKSIKTAIDIEIGHLEDGVRLYAIIRKA